MEVLLDVYKDLNIKQLFTLFVTLEKTQVLQEGSKCNIFPKVYRGKN